MAIDTTKREWCKTCHQWARPPVHTCYDFEELVKSQSNKELVQADPFDPIAIEAMSKNYFVHIEEK
jgi:hypothetical protein